MRVIGKKIAIVILVPLVLYLGLAIVGGGWGDKAALPPAIINAARPLLFAHRGVTALYPGNSLGAINEAARLGFPGLELDLQFSADSQFFVYHDPIFIGTDGDSVTAGTLTADELRSHRLSFEGTPSDQAVPLLSDVVRIHGDRFLYYLDMKRHGHDDIFRLAHDIASFIKKFRLYDRVLVASAQVWFITYLEYTDPQIMTVLEGISTDYPWLLSLIPRDFKPDFIASRQATINDDFVQWLIETGMIKRYIVYHSDEGTFQPTLDLGVEMFIVDYDSQLDQYLAPDADTGSVD